MNPIEAVTHPDPYPFYAGLVAERPLGFDPDLGLWVAADATSVRSALSAPGLRVRPPSAQVPPTLAGRPAGDVFGDLARMTDGDRHARMKRIIWAALGRIDPAKAMSKATEATRRALEAGSAEVDLLMTACPVAVVAALCGLSEPDADEAARLAAAFVPCLRPDATADQLRTADAAAIRLTGLMEPGTDLLAAVAGAAAPDRAAPDRAALSANAVGLLSQTYEATAGLIGSSVAALVREAVRPDDLPAFVRESARHDAPIQNTRRFAEREVRIGQETILAGGTVLVVLAAANRDPAANPDPHTFVPGRQDPSLFTFGAAMHRCPGEELAVAIASGVVGTLLTEGFLPRSGPSAYLPSPNARIPIFAPSRGPVREGDVSGALEDRAGVNGGRSVPVRRARRRD